jgi:hypothetical protein
MRVFRVDGLSGQVCLLIGGNATGFRLSKICGEMINTCARIRRTNTTPVLYRDPFAWPSGGCWNLTAATIPAALVLGRSAAAAFAAPLVASTVSRLLFDLNRSVGHPRLHSEATRKGDSRRRALPLDLNMSRRKARGDTARVNDVTACKGETCPL